MKVIKKLQYQTSDDRIWDNKPAAKRHEARISSIVKLNNLVEEINDAPKISLIDYFHKNIENILDILTDYNKNVIKSSKEKDIK